MSYRDDLHPPQDPPVQTHVTFHHSRLLLATLIVLVPLSWLTAYLLFKIVWGVWQALS